MSAQPGVHQLLDAHSPAELVTAMGGKGAGLHRLARTVVAPGVGVPPFFVVPTSVFSARATPLIEDARRAVACARSRDRAALEQLSHSLIERTRALTLPNEFIAELEQRAAQLGATVAVRSSANVEDSGSRSFAGQLSTEIGVAPAGVAEAVKACWSSLFRPGCLAYLAEAEIDPAQVSVAVVVQRLVPARAAGVAFSASPDGALDEAVIVACFGLGETVVQGSGSVDTYVFQRGAGTFSNSVGQKTMRIAIGPDGRERHEPLPAELQECEVLDEQSRVHLLAQVDAVAQEQQRPMDVEWAFDDKGALWLLQARPVTTLPRGGAGYFDRANVVESFPGITGPLTFSHARESYEHVFRRTLARLGVPERALLEEDGAFRSLLGYLRGRVYYNTASWVRVFRLVPGLEPYLAAWEQMVGVSSRAREASRVRAFSLLGLLRTATLALWNLIALDLQHRAFLRRFDQGYARVVGQDLRVLDAHTLIDLYRGLNASLLAGWEVTFLNDGFAFAFTAVAKTQLEKRGAEPQVLTGLFAADGEIESTAPLTAMRALAADLRGRPALVAKLRACAAGAAFPPVAVDEGERAALATLDLWLAHWGDRRAEELKLESPSFREEPEAFLRLLLAAIGHDERPREAARSSRRAAAEREASQKLGVHLGARALTWFSLAMARRSVRWREASRLRRSRAFGGIRSIFVQIGERLCADRVLDAGDDVFFLQTDEVLGAVKGNGAPDDLRSVVAARRLKLKAFAAERPSDRFATRGIVAAHPVPALRAPPVDADGSIRGLACAGGVARGRALIVRDPNTAPDTRGRVLVAETTDPGWVFLLAPAAALVVEKGSLLSHTAIIGRELGVPTVVNVALATERIPDGAWVEVDGNSGTIRLLDPDEAAKENP